MQAAAFCAALLLQLAWQPGVSSLGGVAPAAHPQVNSNLKIAKDTRRKQGLTALLEALLKLQQANNLQRALK